MRALTIIGTATIATIAGAADTNTARKIESKKEWKNKNSVRRGERSLQYNWAPDSQQQWNGPPTDQWSGAADPWSGGETQPWNGGYPQEWSGSGPTASSYRKGGKGGGGSSGGKGGGSSYKSGSKGGSSKSGGGGGGWYPWQPKPPSGGGGGKSQIVQVVSSNNGQCLSTTNGAPAYATTACTQGGSIDQNFEIIEPFYMPGMAPVVDSFRVRQASSTNSWSSNSWGQNPGICLLAPSGCATGSPIEFGPCDNTLANFYTSDQGSTMVALGCGVFPPAAISAATAGAVTIVNPAVAGVNESFYFQMVIKNNWGGW